MRIHLTEEQRQLLATHPDAPLRVVDDETKQPLVILRADHYERIRPPLDTSDAQPSRIPAEVPEGIRRSKDAFLRDLPELLKNRKRRGQWVAYHGEKRLGFAPTQAALYQRYLRKGLSSDDFYVGKIATHVPEPETIDPSFFEFTEVPDDTCP